MALDEALLESMPHRNQPVLRFYSWTEPAASFGYFQRHAEVESLTSLRPLVRRPTAGGIVPHDADWTYSLAFPPTHDWYGLLATESYRRVHCWLQAAFRLLEVDTELAAAPVKTGAGQCFIGHEQADLLWRGRKIAGAAQRRRKDGLLIQGSVQPPGELLQREDWEKSMLQAATTLYKISWTTPNSEPALVCRANELAETKYSKSQYNRKR
jgi:lipoate-protein ligase A